MEVLTGTTPDAGDGENEPRPEYDPANLLGERILAKVAELKAAGTPPSERSGSYPGRCARRLRQHPAHGSRRVTDSPAILASRRSKLRSPSRWRSSTNATRYASGQSMFRCP